jgi:uncharacterized membrane protein YfcA
MQERERARIVFKLGAAFAVNLAAGYLLALSISPTLLALTNNVVFCILCLYTAYKFEQQLSDDDE